jgi:hypothetical protein
LRVGHIGGGGAADGGDDRGITTTDERRGIDDAIDGCRSGIARPRVDEWKAMVGAQDASKSKTVAPLVRSITC